MWWKFVVCMLILAVIPLGVADNEPGHTTTTVSSEEVSRFLSADAQRLIRSEIGQVQEDLQAYQDENFLLLDQQMRAVITDAQKKLVLGVLGAMLVAGGFISWFMFYIARKYSYEQFLEAQLGTPGGHAYQDEGVQQMQQPEWQGYEQQQTIGMEQGQAYASNTSSFNDWQVQSPYKGGWEWQGGNQQ